MSDRLKWVLTTPDGVRAGWRFAVFALFWYASGYVLFPLVSLTYTFSKAGFTPVDLLVYKSADAAFMLAVSLFMVRAEKHRASWFGLGVGRGGIKLFGAGCLWGFGIVTLLLLVSAAGGEVTFRGLAMHGAELWKYVALWLGAMLLVGLDEELQLRGYALATLTRGIGFWPSAVLLSLIFGADHLSKPMENVPDIFNIVLLGIFLCYSIRRTGSLWFAIGFHASFDFFALSFYGSPNTGNNGLPLEHHLLETVIAGPAWLTGGPQGLEASWLVPPIMLVMFLSLRRVYPKDLYPHD
jgi:hypothetical protein